MARRTVINAQLSRRAVLGSALLVPVPVLAACGSGSAASEPAAASTSGEMDTNSAAADTSAGAGSGAATEAGGPIRISYGSDASQFGELYLPSGTRRVGTVVIIHGGFWLSAYGKDLGTPLAADLASKGWVTWNLEYRRVGDGGGWTETFDDIAAGIDALHGLATSGEHGRIDTSHVVAIGHSAGGQLAAWAADRRKLGVSAPASFGARSIALTGVVSQAGVLDLTKALRDGVGGSAVSDLLGGTPEQFPDRYAIADPTRQLPLGIPVHCVHGDEDSNVPLDQSVDYVAAAQQAGDDAVLHRVQGNHFTLIDVTSAAWTTVVGLLPRLFSS